VNDLEIDRLMRLARPVPPAGLSSGGSELLEEIMSVSPKRSESPPQETASIELTPQLHQPVPRPRSGRRVLIGVGVALAVVFAILTPVLLGSGGGTASPATSSATATPATANPFLLMKVPGWKIGQVSLALGGLNGQVVFDGPGHAQLGVIWGQSSDQEEIYQSQVKTFGKPLTTTLFGEPASLFEVPDQKPYQHVLFPKPGGRPIGLVGGGTDLKTFQQQVQSLVEVTPSQWYAALQDRIVATDTLPAAVTRVLTGVPLPEGFDASKYTGDLPMDYFLFGENLTGAVVCDWMNTYRRAWTAGDESTMAGTEKVLKGAKDWTFVRQTDSVPAWVDALPPYLAKMAARKDLTDAMGSFVCPA
jgi:hypothetical protein